jgi:Bifunctional DNA primase/polymerase, N-terminal/Primase C terminal 1 (PriCT-1)
MSTHVEHAVRYVQAGMAVLPLHRPVLHERTYRCSCGRQSCSSPAKHPFGRLVPNGLRDASSDAKTVESWFQEARINVGIATGAVSGIVVLDIDPRHDGDETVAVLEQEQGPLPHTWRFMTGGGGEHILFRHPGAPVSNSAGKIGPGIDVRADGGYIVAPPSQHISGRPYAISVDHHPDDVQLANLPAWLLRRLLPESAATKPAPEPARDWRSTVSAVIAEGERNRTLASLSGHLLRNRINPWVALDLLQAWNRTHCCPPLAETEVLATVRSIARREISRREGHHER